MTNAAQKQDEELQIRLFLLQEKRSRLESQFARETYVPGADKMKVRARFVPLLREVNQQIIELDSRMARMAFGMPE